MFYQYPPPGSGAGSAAVPTGGLNLDFSWRSGRYTNLTFVVVSGSATLQYWDGHDNPSPIISPVAGTGWHETSKTIQRLQVTGTGTIAIVLNDPPADIDIKALLATAVAGTVSISGTVDTDVGQGTQIAGNTTLETAGVAYDARQIRALTASDTPKLASVVAADATDPRQIRALTSADVLTPYGSAGVALQQDASNYLYHNQAAVTSNGRSAEVSSSSSVGFTGSWQTLYTVPTSPAKTYTLSRLAIKYNFGSGSTPTAAVQMAHGSSLGGADLAYLLDITQASVVGTTYNFTAGVGLYTGGPATFQPWSAVPTLGPGDILQIYTAITVGSASGITATAYWSGVLSPA